VECKGTDERGTISAVGLCALTTILLIGLAAVQFIRGGAGVVSEYEREMQLRLAAESGVETVLLFAEPQLSSLSSTMVRELQFFGKDVSAWVAKPTHDKDIQAISADNHNKKQV